MRILVYGAGVIGCELAHELCQGGNDVTILARGEWRENIQQNGLIIRHSGQLRTTTDYIQTIEILEQNDCYDLIFVVMQYSQVMKILPTLAENASRHLVLVGNNVSPSYCSDQILKIARGEKHIAFGFQGTGGYREKQRVVSMHFKVSMTIGGLNSPLSTDFLQLLQTAFRKTAYQLDWESHMEGWLLSHAAHILPTAYLCYIHNGYLKYSTNEQLHLAVDAVAQAHQMLRQLGYPIRPDGEEDGYTISRKKKLRSLYLMVKSPAGKFVITTHCINAIGEMTALSNAFDQLRQESNVPMPAWDTLLQKVPMKEIAAKESGLSH